MYLTVHRVAEEAVDLPAAPLAQTGSPRSACCTPRRCAGTFRSSASPARRWAGRPSSGGRRRECPAARRAKSPPENCSRQRGRTTPRQPACRWSGGCSRSSCRRRIFAGSPSPGGRNPPPAAAARRRASRTAPYRNIVGLDILPDVKFQQLVAHHGLFAAVLHGLVQIVTVMAVEIARRTGRLEHRRKGDRTRLFFSVAEGENVLVFHVKVPKFTNETDRGPQLFRQI